MAQAIAGETITLTIDGAAILVKVEDASKSEAISARVEASDSQDYHVGQIYEFSRDLLR